MDLNTRLFAKINSLIGKSKFLDAFGRAGAEWVIIAMIGWYITGNLINNPGLGSSFWPMFFLAAAWCVGWILNLLLAFSVREPRPYITNPQFKTLLKPLMSWKSFPSDHAMSAFVIFFMALFLGLPGAWALLPLAFWVIWGRIYAGLHYPFDALGGIAVALFSTLLVKLFV